MRWSMVPCDCDSTHRLADPEQPDEQVEDVVGRTANRAPCVGRRVEKRTGEAVSLVLEGDLCVVRVRRVEPGDLLDAVTPFVGDGAESISVTEVGVEVVQRLLAEIDVAVDRAIGEIPVVVTEPFVRLGILPAQPWPSAAG